MLRLMKIHCLLSFSLVVGLNDIGIARQLPAQTDDAKLDAQVASPLGHASDKLSTESNMPPSIVVRPTSNPATPAVDCQIEFEPMSGENENQYRLKLVIPQSVREIEIFPQAHHDNRRRTRVVIDQGTDLLEPVSAPVTPLIPSPSPLTSLNDSLPLTNGRQFVKNPHFRTANPLASAAPIFASNPYIAPNPPRSHETASLTIGDAIQLPDSKSDRVVSNPPGNTVQLSMAGPRSLKSGEQVEFEIALHNDSPVDCRGLIVQLRIPIGLEICQLDRVAWLDQRTQVITWEISQLRSLQRESIRYLARSSQPGEKVQHVIVAMAGELMAQTDLSTRIVQSATLSRTVHHFSDSDASLASFNE